MSPEQAPPAVSRRGLRLTGVAAVVIAAAVVIIGITTRKMADARLREWTEIQAVPLVAVAVPDNRGNRTSLDLPARLEAYSQAQSIRASPAISRNGRLTSARPSKPGSF